ncbi:hypothetical protein [Prosthecobacter sp.]|uniref:hypothetical protein n=1 Tax=Prosthecobacter sp. TaxID=1965333 RepID=UPI002AB80D0E|nr:hypothetical protein [Prosthecobacter sp.]MDZ4405446.1 hypothetical protein [Prosthecobacter sp.]
MSAFSRLTTLLLPLLIASCVNLGTPAERQKKARRLSLDLQQLSPTVNAREADQLALTAIETSAELARDFKPLRFPWMNNGLVNTGLRKRGLCYQWRDDLFPFLHRLNLKSMDLHLTSARRTQLLEHNGIVVTAKGQRFEEGIILDPWRHCGVLAWAKVAKDRYPWKPLPRELTPMVLRPLLMPEPYLSR